MFVLQDEMISLFASLTLSSGFVEMVQNDAFKKELIITLFPGQLSFLLLLSIQKFSYKLLVSTQ